MNYYWLCPDENFSPHCMVSRWRCDHFSKEWPKSKTDTTFTHKKTSVTPTFCKRNFSRMNRFGLMNFLSSTDPSSVNFQILHFWPKAIFNQKSQLSNENWVGKIPNIVSFGDRTQIISYYRGGVRWGQKIHKSKTVHPRKISLTESRGNRSFLWVKVESDFDFVHFLEKWLQRHLESKLWGEKFSSGHNQ